MRICRNLRITGKAGWEPLRARTPGNQIYNLAGTWITRTAVRLGGSSGVAFRET